MAEEPLDIEAAEEDEEPRRMSCPRCGSADVRKSRANSFLGYFNSMFGRRPYRCRSCRVKFYRNAPRPQHQH